MLVVAEVQELLLLEVVEVVVEELEEKLTAILLSVLMVWVEAEEVHRIILTEPTVVMV
jgi:hypothetical protein